jgi:quercetin dioxygenase-like cupin family protein
VGDIAAPTALIHVVFVAVASITAFRGFQAGASSVRFAPVARVIPVDDVRYTPSVALFEGHDDSPVSVYVTEFECGDGTPLHLHPYPEVFLVEKNTAVFTAGDEELTVGEGNFVIVPANTPHRYVGASAEPVRVVSVHASGAVEQTNL